MEIVEFDCPVCDTSIELKFTEKEKKEIEDYVKENGRSPSYHVKCDKNHELLVLISVTKNKNNTELYVRDIAQLLQKTADNNEELDWLKKHFG
ncbi:MAG: hypothetical protein ACTSQY_01750 [Candidatus Odinarchaeia archaeon]